MKKYFNNFFIVFAVAVMAVYGFTGCGSDDKTKTVTESSWTGASCDPTATGGKVLPSSVVAPEEDGTTDGETATISNGDTITWVAADSLWEYDVTATCVGISGATQIGEKVRIKFTAGATVIADTSQLSYLSIKRGGQIEAIGTSSNPIVFTSANAVGSRGSSDWGGIVIHGKAATNNTAGSNFSSDTEIQTGSYGCTDTTTANCAQNNSSGTIQYTRVEFAGYEISSGKEFNGIFLAGVGSGTTIDHVQVHRGSDDGIEIFGGTVNLSYVVLTYNDDDGFDLDEGWSGVADHFVIAKGSDIGDSCIEYDGLGKDSDRASQSFFSNFTFLGQGTGKKETLINIKKEGALLIANSYFGNFDDQGLTHQGESASSPNSGTISDFFASTAIPASLTDNSGEGYISALRSNLFENVAIGSSAATAITDLLDDDEDVSTALGTNHWDDNANNAFASSMSVYTAPSSYWGEGGASDFLPSSTPTVTTYYTDTVTGFNGSTLDLSGISYVGAFSSSSDTWMSGWTSFPEN